jgi:hypothetical protein
VRGEAVLAHDSGDLHHCGASGSTFGSGAVVNLSVKQKHVKGVKVILARAGGCGTNPIMATAP